MNNPKHEEMKTNHKLYIVIDVQNDFVTGSLGSDWANETTDNIAKFLKSVKDDKDTMGIWATRDTHYNDESRREYGETPYFETLEGLKLPVLHCVKDTEGWEIDSRVAPYIADNRRYNKPTFMSEWLGRSVVTYSSLTATDYARCLDEIVLMGFCTSICVISNALYLRGLFPDLKITVIENLCADVSKEAHDAALTVMRNCQIDVETIVFADDKPCDVVESYIISLASAYNTNSEHETVSDKSHLYEDLVFDDLDRVEFIMRLEEKYKISISDEEETTLLTVGDIINIVNSKINGKKKE